MPRHDPPTRPSDSPTASPLDRRDFMVRAAGLGLGLAAGVAGSTRAAEPKVESRNLIPGNVYRRLGRTNMAVSALAIGGVVLNKERMPVFEAAIDRGLNFVMAHGGKCAQALAPWLSQATNRNRIFLGYAGQPKAIDGALSTLKTDCIDLVMAPIHSPKDAANQAVADAFAKAKKAGKARYLCLVFHSNVPAVWKAGLEAGWYDVLLPTYNWASRKTLQPLIAQTRAKDIGLIAMKTLKGIQKNQEPIGTWKRFLADGIDVIIKGMTRKAELDRYLALARQDDTTPPASASTEGPLGECALCGTCTPCPQGVSIQDVMRTWQYYACQLGWRETARAHFAAIPAPARPTSCADCGRCEALCPQHVPIRRLLREAQQTLV